MAHDDTGFDDIFFPIRVDFGVEGGEENDVTIQATGAGREWRNSEWDDVRNRWDAASRIHTFAESDLVTAFFRARKAQTYSFRWKDWTDFTAIGGTTVPAVGDGVNDVFNLYKNYDDDINPTSRRIALPIDSAVYGSNTVNGTIITPFKVYLNGVEESAGNYTVDYRNGRITFQPGLEPGGGVVVTWDGEFHVPVRFDTGQLRKRFVSHDNINFEELPIVEILAEDILETPDA